MKPVTCMTKAPVLWSIHRNETGIIQCCTPHICMQRSHKQIAALYSIMKPSTCRCAMIGPSSAICRGIAVLGLRRASGQPKHSLSLCAASLFLLIISVSQYDIGLVEAGVLSSYLRLSFGGTQTSIMVGWSKVKALSAGLKSLVPFATSGTFLVHSPCSIWLSSFNIRQFRSPAP